MSQAIEICIFETVPLSLALLTPVWGQSDAAFVQTKVEPPPLPGCSQLVSLCSPVVMSTGAEQGPSPLAVVFVFLSDELNVLRELLL